VLALAILPTLYQRRQQGQARLKVLQALTRHGFTDGIQQLSFQVEQLGSEHWFRGWFKGLDGVAYGFEWRGNTLSYRQIGAVQPILGHTLTVPNPRKLTRRLSSDQRAQHQALVNDRATFSCGLGRCPRNRLCRVTGAALEQELRTLIGLFS
jgi:hypothetical protein